MAHIFDLILIFAFVAYVSYDYVKTKNKLKLLFFIPILLSFPMITSWPSLWTERQFFYYRMTVILSCFIVGFIYITKSRRQQEQATKNQPAKAKQGATKQQKRNNSKR